MKTKVKATERFYGLVEKRNIEVGEIIEVSEERLKDIIALGKGEKYEEPKTK